MGTCTLLTVPIGSSLPGATIISSVSASASQAIPKPVVTISTQVTDLAQRPDGRMASECSRLLTFCSSLF